MSEGRLLITGGAGFIGSHVAEFFSRKYKVIALDNLSRFEFLGKQFEHLKSYNWEHLRSTRNVRLMMGDVRKSDEMAKLSKDVDVIIHAAGQVAVTTSVEDPTTDFEVNARGTFNVLDAARRSTLDPVVLVCSTNKVYGSNVNKLPIKELPTRYGFTGVSANGLAEDFGVDLCDHTPYGVSKLVADLYAQDFARTYGLKTGVFRMSCIYGPRQFGQEDQGWVAWFAIATMNGLPITIYGNGKQVRDVLYIDDLLEAFNQFLRKYEQPKGEVFNLGGGPNHTLSLIELIDLLGEMTGKRTSLRFEKWRPSDQKVYVSDIRKAEEKLSWSPKIGTRAGVKRMIRWISSNNRFFRKTT